MNASNRFRPRIEFLEDRRAPSTLAVSSPQDSATTEPATVLSSTAHTNNGQHYGHGGKGGCYCVYID